LENLSILNEQRLRFNAVTYSNSAKHKMLGVSETLLAERNPYNVETAAQMAEGIRKIAGTNIGFSFTGLAGNHRMDGVAGGKVFIGLAGLTDKLVVKKVVLDPAIRREQQKQIFAEAGLCFLKAYLNHELHANGGINC
jgi:nicotinamide mononucleotide (NMN) deamidase PncC